MESEESKTEFDKKESKTEFDKEESKAEFYKEKESLFLDLYEECNNTNSKIDLTKDLKSRLEKLPKDVRKEIASTTKDGCSPFFLACRRGHASIVKYMITVCGVDIEQRGTYELPDGKSDRCVTPLWCAAISGKLNVTICLVRHGADINAVSDTGSTPVSGACFMSYFDVVAYLVEHGADVNKGNHAGVTCLINSVNNVALCFFLIQYGAKINLRDAEDKTALHYAVKADQFDTTKLLLLFGADPYARNMYGEDALQMACLRGYRGIFDLLVWRACYHPERLAEAHELLGSVILEKFEDVEMCLYHWNAAADIRRSVHPFLKKLPELLPRSCYQFAKEFTTKEELESMSSDLTALQMQCLLIYERILGPSHSHTMFRLKYRGAEFVDDLMFNRGLDLWKRALDIRVEYDTILFGDTAVTAQAVVHSYLDLKNMGENMEWKEMKCFEEASFEEILETFQLLANELPGAKKLLEIRPISKRQQESYDKILQCLTHLIYLLVEAGKTGEQVKTIRSAVTKLLGMQPRSAIHDDTLLHLSVSRLNTISDTKCADDEGLVVFPNVDVVKVLLDCGAPINATNKSGSTPLHIAANTYNFSAPIVELLLERGAHLDKPNIKGECPKSLLMQNQTGLYLMQYVTLKCLAATAVVKYNISCKGHIPATLESFLTFHQP